MLSYFNLIQKFIDSLDNIIVFERKPNTILLLKKQLYKALNNIKSGNRITHIINFKQENSLPAIKIITIKENIPVNNSKDNIFITFEINLITKDCKCYLNCCKEYTKVNYYLKNDHILSNHIFYLKNVLLLYKALRFY